MDRLLLSLCDPEEDLHTKLMNLHTAADFMKSRDHWDLAARLLARNDKGNDRFLTKQFITEALELTSRENNYKSLTGLILVLPLALRLFNHEYKHEFVAQCC